MIENIIKTVSNQLSDSENIIAMYIIKNKNIIGQVTSTELAKKIGVSQSSIIKFIKKIGFSGYIAFKLQLERDLEKCENLENKLDNNISLQDSLEVVTKKVLSETIETLNNSIRILDYKNFEIIIEKIRNSNRILIIGAGMSSIVARDLELKLMKIKIDTVHYDSKQMQLMKLSTMNKKDLIIAISHRGETQEVIDVIKIAKEMKIKVISITSIGKNSVSSLSDYNISVVSKETIFRSSAISSRMAHMMIVDSIFLRLLQKDYKKAKKYIDKSKEIVGWVKK